MQVNFDISPHVQRVPIGQFAMKIPVTCTSQVYCRRRHVTILGMLTYTPLKDTFSPIDLSIGYQVIVFDFTYFGFDLLRPECLI